MLKSPASRPMTPDTVWLARGRHTGPAPLDDVRRNLARLREAGTVDAFLEPDDPPAREDPGRLEQPGHRHPWHPGPFHDAGRETPESVFEARWRVAGQVTVRARLTVRPTAGSGAAWVLVAEAERRWDPRWPSPAEIFWPADDDLSWDHSATAALRSHAVNPLPRDDDKALRRLLKDCAHDGWSIHVLVHEAMTPDARGRLPLTRFLEPGLRDRVVEHRAAPDQWRAVDYALKEHGVRLPRGGAVILPGSPAPSWYTEEEFSVRTVFLDGSEPAELTGALKRFAALPRPLPAEGEEALTALREQWHLMTLEERLERADALVAMYAAALDAMTRSRDLYREAAERAEEALKELRESLGRETHRSPADAPGATGQGRGSAPGSDPGTGGSGSGFSLRQLTRTLERVRAGRTGRSTQPQAPAALPRTPALPQLPPPAPAAPPTREDGSASASTDGTGPAGMPGQRDPRW